MKKVLKWILFAFIILIIIGIIADKSENNSDEKTEVVKDSEQKIAITTKEHQMVELLINNDVTSSLNGGKSMLATNYIQITAKELQKVYASNEARGDKNYKDKNIIITGIVKSIDSSIGDIPVISLKTDDMFNAVRLNLAKKYRSIAADLDKNQKVTFACVGDGVIIGSPTLTDCKPVPSEVSKITNDQMKLVNKFIKGDNKIPNDIKKIVLMVKLLGQETNDFAQCQEININCMNESEKLLSKMNKEKLQEKMKQLSVEISE